MTWEITLGIFAILSAFIAVFNIVVRVNKTLCSLEAVVKQIKECLEHQSEKNGLFFSRLSEHDIRLTRIEDRLDMHGAAYRPYPRDPSGSSKNKES